MSTLRIRQGASDVDSGSTLDTVVHVVDEDDDPLCGINPKVTEPWFRSRDGVPSEVTCNDCQMEITA